MLAEDITPGLRGSRLIDYLSSQGIGLTDLFINYTSSSATIISSTGTDAILLSADATNAGLLSAANYTALTSISTTYLAKANNLSDLASVANARTNLGLGTLATQSGTFSGTSSGTNTGDQSLTAFQTHIDIVAGNPHGTVIGDIDNLQAILDNSIRNGQNGESSYYDLLDVLYGGTEYYTTIVLSSRSTDGAYLDADLELDASQYAGLKKGTNYLRVTDAGYSVYDAAAFRTALSLGTLATQSGTFSGTSSGTNTGDQSLAAYLTSATAATTYLALAGGTLTGNLTAVVIAASGNVTAGGNGLFTGSVRAGSGSWFGWLGKGYILSPADGVIKFSNGADTSFNRLQFGGTTSSYPSIKRNGTAINFRLADDSADAPITAAAITASGAVTLGIKTIATLPSAASSSGERFQVSDSATIINRIAFSNGSAWYYEGTAVAV